MIAVIGAGPIGIYVSRLLLAQGHEVQLFECGDYLHESNLLTQNSYIFKTKSAMPQNVHRVGGGSNYWHARFGEFLSEDFSQLSSLKIAGWPLKKASLIEHYKRVSYELSADAMSDDEYIDRYFSTQKYLLGEKLDLRVFRFAEEYSFVSKLKELEGHPKFTLHTRSKVESITYLTDCSTIVCNVRNDMNLNAVGVDYVIITAGTLQSTKLLLQSPNSITESNRRIVGLGLMEHLEGFVGLMRVPNKNVAKLSLFSLSRNNRISNLNAGIGIRLNSVAQASLELPSLHIEIRPRPRQIKTQKFLFRGPVHNPVYYLERVIKKNFEQVARLLDFFLGRITYGVWIKSEEFANSCSNLSLNSSNQGLIYNHQVSNLTYQQLYKALDLLLPEVERNLGVRIDRFRWVRKRARNIQLEVNWHPMGTLPMGPDASTCVCDENLEVHAMKKVFILSPAVFNRGSNGNPTFTSLALASRLVDENFAKNKRYAV